MGHIRPLAEEDIPQVIDLHRRLLRNGQPFSAETESAYRTYFNEIFLRHPWSAEGLPSLVYQGDKGKIAGCLGVLPCRMSWKGKPIQVAMGHHFMVEPDSRSTMAALELLKTFLVGPQDLAMATEANNTSRKIWEGVGGRTSLLYSLRWTRALRPSRFVLSRLRTRPSLMPLAFAFSPFCLALDAVLARVPESHFRLSRPEATDEELTVEALFDGLRELSRRRGLSLMYDHRVLQWLFALLGQIKTPGSFQKVLVRNSDGKILGWYLYYLKPGGVSEVVQIGAPGKAMEEVLDHLFYHAWRGGSVAVSGQVDPFFMQDFLTKHCFLHGGSWTLVHSRDSGLLQTIDRGDIFLTRLEGEWTIGF